MLERAEGPNPSRHDDLHQPQGPSPGRIPDLLGSPTSFLPARKDPLMFFGGRNEHVFCVTKKGCIE